MRRRRIISPPPYPEPPMTAARYRLPVTMPLSYTARASLLAAPGVRDAMFQDRVEIGISWLAGQRLAMQRLLERLVRQSSFTQDPPGVNAVVSLIDAELRRIGIRTERIPSPRFGDHLSFRTTAQGEAVFLLGHTDTVFPSHSFEGFELAGDMARP